MFYKLWSWSGRKYLERTLIIRFQLCKKESWKPLQVQGSTQTGSLQGQYLSPSLGAITNSSLFASASYWEIIQWDSSTSGGREGGISAFVSEL